MEEDYKDFDKYIKAKKRVEDIKGFYIHLVVYIVVNIFLMIPILKYSEPGNLSFWSFSTAFFWGIGVAGHAYSVFGKNILFSKEWEERKIKEIMDKDKSDFWE